MWDKLTGQSVIDCGIFLLIFYGCISKLRHFVNKFFLKCDFFGTNSKGVVLIVHYNLGKTRRLDIF